MNIKKVCIFYGIFAVLFNCVISAQTNIISKPHVAVIGFINNTNDESFDTPSETATNNLVFSLHMLGLYEITETDTIPEGITDKRLETFARSNGFDYVIYGNISTGKDDSQNYSLAVFNSVQKKTTIKDSAQGFSVLDVFSVMDTLLPSVLSSITGKHVGFGAVSFQNTGEDQSYEVDIDGTIIPDSPTMAEYIISGSHYLRVTTITNGAPVEVTAMQVEITENETTPVSFEIKAYEPEPVIVAPPKTWGPVFSIYGSLLYPFATYSKMVKGCATGGILGEFRLSKTNETYFVVRAQGGWMVPVEKTIKTYFHAAALAGIAANFITTQYFVMQGELDGGAWLHSITLDSTVVNGELLKSNTVAPAIQASLALRLFAGSFGLEIAPVFTVLPEKSAILFLAGCRAGALIRIQTNKE